MKKLLFITSLFLFSAHCFSQTVEIFDPTKAQNMRPVTATSGVTWNYTGTTSVTLVPPATTTNVTLSGSFNIKPGVPGTMVTPLRWYKLSYKGGMEQASVNPYTLTGATAGVYWFRARQFKDSDIDTAFYQDFKVVIYPDANNKAEAGTDTTIYAPSQTTFRVGGVDVPAPVPFIRLDGSGSKGGTTWAWTRVSGPNVPNITTPNSTATTVTGMVHGTYVFQLTVNGTMTDQITVEYIDKANQYVATQNRSGAPVKHLLPPTAKGVAADGQRWAEYKYPKLAEYIASTGKTLMGYDGVDLDLEGGKDSITAIHLDGFGGTPTGRVVIGPTVSRWNMKYRLAEFYIGMSGNSVRYVTIDGTMIPGEPYGIRLDNTEAGKLYPKFYRLNSDGTKTSMFKVNFYFGFVQDVTLRGVKALWTGGIKAKMEGKMRPPAQAFTWKYNNLLFEKIWIENSDNEAFYIGSTDPGGTKSDEMYSPSPRLGNVTIRDVIILRCMWNAIQLANTIEGAHIENVFAYNAGAENISGQKSAIELGGNSNGYIRNCVVKNGTGNAFSIFGHGLEYNEVSGNVADSIGGTDFGSPVIYAQAMIPYYEYFPGNRLNIFNNVLTMRSGFAAIKLEDTGPNFGASLINTNKVIYAGGTLIKSKTGGTISSMLEYSSDIGAPWTGDIGTQVNFNWTFDGVYETPTGYKIYGKINGVSSNWTSIASWNATLKEESGLVGNAPVISSLNDQEISLPTNTVTFNPTVEDADGDIPTYFWQKISTIAATMPASVTTKNITITNMGQGEHTFRLTVSDNTFTRWEEVSVLVNPLNVVSNKPPTANAGGDATLTGLTEVTLEGSGIDEDGIDVKYSWSLVSGPNVPTITAPVSSATTVTGLVATGVTPYVFRLTVTDDDGATATDDVQVLVTLPVVTTNFKNALILKKGKKQ